MSQKPITIEKVNHILSRLYDFPVYDLPFGIKCILIYAGRVDELIDELVNDGAIDSETESKLRGIFDSIKLWNEDSAEKVSHILQQNKDLKQRLESLEDGIVNGIDLEEIIRDYKYQQVG